MHDAIDDGDRAFIEARDMFFLATVDADGRAAVLLQGRRAGLRARARRADDRVPELRRQRHVPLAREHRADPHVGLLFIDFEGQ